MKAAAEGFEISDLAAAVVMMTQLEKGHFSQSYFLKTDFGKPCFACVNAVVYCTEMEEPALKPV